MLFEEYNVRFKGKGPEEGTITYEFTPENKITDPDSKN